ncbi:glycerate kinase [Roseobacter sp.]|uniref:glycerate kinase type-2 family protein n=1 Tax=Roseobacter sp. TaxID=1907202 RepID=UPI00385952F7
MNQHLEHPDDAPTNFASSNTWDATDRAVLIALLEAAVSTADPYEAIKANLPKPPKGRTVVIGAGKGATQLARAFEQQWTLPLSGVVVTRYCYDVPCDQITVLSASHPIPDNAGLDASRQITDAVQDLTKDDLVVALIRGGGSALLPMPLDDLTLQDEIDLNTSLLNSGAPISVMNALRGQFSAIKSGHLAQMAHPAKVVTLVVSDVPGDDPAPVASVPTIPNWVAREDALNLIDIRNISMPPHLTQWLETAPSDLLPTQDSSFALDEVIIIASARKSLEAAAERAKEIGIPAVILSDQIEGEAKKIAKMHAAIAAEISRNDRPFPRPVVLLSGGETTVTLAKSGKGGRISEFALSLALAGAEFSFSALVADTDGIDGSEENAGAFVSGQSAKHLKSLGLNPEALLANHDSWAAFYAIGDLFSPGPTGTNVNDFRAILLR